MMNACNRAMPIFLVLLLAGGCATTVTTADRIAIEQNGASFEVTVPKSRLILSVPKDGLTMIENHHGGATDSPRYFYFQDMRNSRFLSGWFEPAASRAHPLEDSWKTEMTKLKAQGFGDPVDVVPLEIGSWHAILYSFVLQPGVTDAHVRASYVGAGTWVDLHASLVGRGSSADARESVVALVRSLQLREKP